jgi:hypothetical protein
VVVRIYGLNLPSWEEPLRMIAEGLSASQIDVAAGKLLVQGALRIDPVLLLSDRTLKPISGDP